MIRREIDEVIGEVFGDAMGFQEPHSDGDPFESSDDDADDDVQGNGSEISGTISTSADSTSNLEPYSLLNDSFDEPDTTATESDSISAPEFEPWSGSDHDFSC